MTTERVSRVSGRSRHRSLITRAIEDAIILLVLVIAIWLICSMVSVVLTWMGVI